MCTKRLTLHTVIRSEKSVASLQDRMIRAAKLDVQLYEEVEADQGAMAQAMTVVILSAVAAGIGSANVGLLGIVIGKSGVFFFRHISEIADKVHDLVIAEQQMHAPTVIQRLAFESHEQIHDLSRVGASIEDVAGYDEMSRTAAPTLLLTQDTRLG